MFMPRAQSGPLCLAGEPRAPQQQGLPQGQHRPSTNLSAVVAVAVSNQLRDRRDDLQQPHRHFHEETGFSLGFWRWHTRVPSTSRIQTALWWGTTCALSCPIPGGDDSLSQRCALDSETPRHNWHKYGPTLSKGPSYL